MQGKGTLQSGIVTMQEDAIILTIQNLSMIVSAIKQSEIFGTGMLTTEWMVRLVPREVVRSVSRDRTYSGQSEAQSGTSDIPGDLGAAHSGTCVQHTVYFGEVPKYPLRAIAGLSGMRHRLRLTGRERQPWEKQPGTPRDCVPIPQHE